MKITEINTNYLKIKYFYNTQGITASSIIFLEIQE